MRCNSGFALPRSVIGLFLNQSSWRAPAGFPRDSCQLYIIIIASGFDGADRLFCIRCEGLVFLVFRHLIENRSIGNKRKYWLKISFKGGKNDSVMNVIWINFWTRDVNNICQTLQLFELSLLKWSSTADLLLKLVNFLLFLSLQCSKAFRLLFHLAHELYTNGFHALQEQKGFTRGVKLQRKTKYISQLCPSPRWKQICRNLGLFNRVEARIFCLLLLGANSAHLRKGLPYTNFGPK